MTTMRCHECAPVSVQRSPEPLLTCIDIPPSPSRYQISRKIARDLRDPGIDIFFVKNQRDARNGDNASSLFPPFSLSLSLSRGNTFPRVNAVGYLLQLSC